jgi:hypothetical protein
MPARASRTAGSVGAAFALLSAVAAAQPPADAQREARTRFERGVEMFERGDNDAALAEFLAAYALVPRPSVLFNLAATYEALRRYPDAVDAYTRFLAGGSVERHDRARAERSLTRLRPLLASLRLRVAPEGAELRVDDLAPRPAGDVVVSPGEHRVVARWPDGRESTARVVVASGQSLEVLLEAPPLRAPVVEAVPAPTSRLALRAVPPGAALRVDGALHPLAESLTLPLGAHILRIDAQGLAPWEGAVQVDARGAELRFAFAAPARGPSPVVFWTVAGAAAALLLSAAVTGALALDAHADFDTRYRDDPGLAALARRGDGLALATDGLLLGAAAAAVGALVLGTQTTFTTPRTTAVLHALPPP